MRDFKIWKYSVSHSRLLIRSPKNDNGQKEFNIDLVFEGVEFLHLCTMHQRLHLSEWENWSFDASLEEIQFLEDASIKIRTIDKVFVLRGDNGDKWYIGAGYLSIKMNQMDLLETPIDTL